MSARITCLAALGVLATAYIAYPVATLYRLGAVVASGDPAGLRGLVDWPSVREGVKQDMDDGDELAPIGASFMRSIVVDSTVTPSGILAGLRAASGHGHAGIRLRNLYFETPTRFVAEIGTGDPHATIRLRMDMRDGVWKVTRAWLPSAMLNPPSPVQAAAAVR
jgi:hypothetical protein